MGRTVGLAILAALAGCADEGTAPPQPGPPAPLQVTIDAAVRSGAAAFGSGEVTLDSVRILLAGATARTASWTVGSSAPWIELLDQNGTGPGVIRWRRRSGDYQPGAYVDSIVVTVPGATGSPLRILDSMIILAPISAALALATGPTSVKAVTTVGGAPIADSVPVRLSGALANQTYWFGARRAPWNRLVKSEGVGSGSLRWVRDPVTLGPGVYVDTLSVVASGLESQVIDSLIVRPAASLRTDPAALRDSVPLGFGANRPDSIMVEAVGAAAGRNWTAVNRRASTTLVTRTGVGAGMIRLERHPAGLAAGRYVDTIAVWLVDDPSVGSQVIDTLKVGPVPEPLALRLIPTGRSVTATLGDSTSFTDSIQVVVGGDGSSAARWTAAARRAATVLSRTAGVGTGFLRWTRSAGGLPLGIYIDTVTVTLPGAVGSPARFVDSLVVLQAATPLRVTAPSSRYREAELGSGAPAPDQVAFLLDGIGADRARWTATVTRPWLQLTSGSGIGSGMLRWIRKPAGLPAGVYVDTIRVAVSALSEPWLLIDSLVVKVGASSAPLADLSVSTLVDSVPAGSSEPRLAEVTLRIGGPNGAATTWSASSRGAWIEVATKTGTGPGPVRWARLPAGLRAGTYVDTVHVDLAGGAGLFVVDSMVVLDRGLALSPASTVDTVVAGAGGVRTDSSQVVLAGAGAASVPWTVTRSKPWNSLNTSGGTGPGQVKWTSNPGGLVPGVYVDSIIIVAPGVPGSPAVFTDSLVVLPANIPVGEAPSPTGRNPKLLWTKKRQWVWNKMRAENHPWWQLIKGNADKTGTAGERYGDRGQWAMLAYQVTGDATYGRKAWDKIRTLVNPATFNGNEVRESAEDNVVLYDWLYPVLTAAERTEFVTALNRWADYCLEIGYAPYASGYLHSDSDQTTGCYFGLAFTDLATGPENPRAGTFLSNTERGMNLPVGGLTASGANFQTTRNTIARYVELAEGGEWIESGEYNPGTLQLLLMGAEGIRTATGVDYFPEVTRLTRQLASGYTYLLTSDLTQVLQWGDEEHPRDLQYRLFKHVPALGMLGGLAQDTPEGQAANGLVADLVAKYGAVGYGTAEPWMRIFYFYNPYAGKMDWRAQAPGNFAAGQGLLKVRNGTSLFSAHMPNRSFVDHEVSFLGNFQLYRNGEWAVTHPLGYGQTAVSAVATNSMLLGGLNTMYNRAVVAAQSGADWWAVTGRTWGSYYGASFYQPPPAFVDGWVRSVVYFQEAGNDVIVVRDSVTADDPLALGGTDRYRAPDASKLTGGNRVAQWIIHTPVSPSMDAPNRFSWTTAKGQSVVVHNLLPAALERRVLSETALLGSDPGLYINPAELKYQVRVSPAAWSKTTVFVSVIVVGPTPLSPTVDGSSVRVGATQVSFGSGGVTVIRP